MKVCVALLVVLINLSAAWADGLVFDDAQATYNQVKTIRDAHGFHALEALANDWRTSRARFPSGNSKLHAFYLVVAEVKGRDEASWAAVRQFNEDWIAAVPDSATARIAAANFYMNWAFHARGGGFANTVSDDGWRLYRERLAAGMKVLQDGARHGADHDPAYLASLIDYGNNLDDGIDVDKQHWLQCVAVDPEYWSAYQTLAFAMLPRWHGQAGDGAALADEAVRRTPALGQTAYARIAMSLGQYRNVGLYTTERFSWPRVKQGFDDMLKRHPKSATLYYQAALAGQVAGDKAYTAAMVNRCGTHGWGGIESARLVRIRTWLKGP
ncbi:MAG TPA: hypothetical protein VGO93_19115 [Candidatus Xenobia bacterium]